MSCITLIACIFMNVIDLQFCLGLAGKDEIEKAQAGSILDAAETVVNLAIDVHFENDEPVKVGFFVMLEYILKMLFITCLFIPGDL